MAKKTKINIAAIADIHTRIGDKGRWADYFSHISKKADILLICGDLTDTGDEEEAQVLAEELKSCTIPVIGVLGNHDYEKGRQKLIRQVLHENSMTILDGEAIVIEDIGFAGTKGFGGGFDKYMLSMFGEDAMKNYVQEAVDQSLLLDRALARLEQDNPGIVKIALLHYAPIKETVIGEPEQIFPFLGSSRLADPLHRRKVYAAFHGHAHAGQLNGVTSGGVRVFNVALPILKKSGQKFPFQLLEV
ncbi:metallophosphoesterase [Olivibacter sp. SDN3]|uniref:metallophosphoesterase family protein n=1 Tax=Olivibacter sp. SDN3 TaxID=2764720 RepID=UPI001650EE84|nr:metallophosphoesterase [Olivibacter sp. SDN3]QNL48357.1 metallophosphoesterase [Olivibacter sp. SDN3]